MVKYYPNLKVSESDKNKYRAFKLDNQLMVYLIQNPEAEKAGASLQCHVGSLRDPREHQGLAHFLEHMLFIGSAKYPGEGEFMTFLGQNGGYSNAYTSNYVTNYHLEIKDDKLSQALDMFAQFFVSPLFKDESVFKEINAVNSEAEMYYNNDSWRYFNLNSLLCDPKAELSKYNVGNLDTLGNLRGHIPSQSDKNAAEHVDKPVIDSDALERRNKLVKSLKDFHARYYSANQMALCVYTKRDLDSIEKEVIKIFSQIEDKKIEYQSFKNEIQPFPKETLGKFVKLVPVNKGQSLKFIFRLPEYQSDIYFKSGEYLSHLIGHESKGSILDLLSEEGLALNLSSGFDRNEEYMASFEVTIKLTKKGSSKENMRKVISALGAYLKMLKKVGPQAWIYEEIKTQNDLKFKYQDTRGGVNKCIELVSDYADYMEPEGVLYNSYEHRGFKPDMITGILSQMTADNLHLLFISDELSGVENFSTDPFYKTRYLSEPIREDVRSCFEKGDISWSKLTDKIRLPDVNIFLPKNFDLKPAGEEKGDKEPTKARETEDSTVWHWQDNKFKLPKAISKMQIYIDPGQNLRSAKAAQMFNLWNRLYTDKMRSLSYMAEMAKIDSSTGCNHFGLTINVSCFNESLKPYLIKMMDTLREFKEEGFTEEKFQSYQEKEELDLLRVRNDMPFRFILGTMIDYLQEFMFSNEDSLQGLRSITYQDMVEFSKRLFNNVRFEWIIEGNVTSKEADEISTEVESKFKGIFGNKVLQKENVSNNRVVKLVKGKTPIVEVDSLVAAEKNQCFLKVYQVCNGDQCSALLKFIENWLKSPFFEELRTQQQLGYAVFALNRVYGGVRHFGFCIQSDVKSNHFCIGRTMVFLVEKQKELSEMPNDKFEEIRAGVIANLKEPNKTLQEQFDEDWGEIKSHQYKFNRRNWLTNEVAKITKEDVLVLYNEIFFDNPRTFELHLYSQVTKEESVAQRIERQEKDKSIVVYPNAQAFQNSCELHVDTYSKL